MKQLLEFTLDESFDLIKYFNTKNNLETSEKIFFNLIQHGEYYSFLQSNIDNESDRTKKAKLGVRIILASAVGVSVNYITPEKTLKVDLNISPNVFSRLHRPFNKLLRSLNSSKIIRSSGVAKCKTVKDCQDLVVKKL